MEKSTAPDPDDQSSGAGGVGESEPKPLPDFEPSTDGIKDVHMEADGQRNVGTLIAEGKLFTALGADAIAAADLVRSYANTVWKVAQKKAKPGDWAAAPAVSRLVLESLHVDFVAGAGESVRLGDDSSPAIEAAQTVTHLMQLHGDELVELARKIGPEGTVAYRGLLKAIGEAGDDAKVTWEARSRGPVTVTSIQAMAAHKKLSEEGERHSDKFKVLGRLSMADDDLNHFKLKLFKDGPRPRQLKPRQSVVRGDFDDEVGNSVRERGLWGKPVEALVLVEQERADSVATPRDPRYTLLSVEATEEPSSRRKGSQPLPGSSTLNDRMFGSS
jgi:hypothetical protein